MKVKTTHTLENISLVWMTTGCLALCSIILIGVIAIARPFIKSNSRATTPIVQAQTITSSSSTNSTGTNSSDSSSLYP